jgi:hypothetical protein
MEARDGETEGEGGASTPLPHVFGVLSLEAAAACAGGGSCGDPRATRTHTQR